MSIDRMVDLKALHLYGMAAAGSEWLAELGHQQKPVIPEVWLDRLIAAEQAYRQSRSLNYQLRAARFPIHRHLLNFNWSETPLAQHGVEQLATAGFTDRITHHCDILETGNDSYRFKQRKKSTPTQ